MRTKTDAAWAKIGTIEYSPDLVQGYVIDAHRQRTEFIKMGWKTLNARVRAWLGISNPRPQVQEPRIVAQSGARPMEGATPEQRRAA